MSLGRIAATARLDLAFHLRRPLFVCWILILGLLLWGLSSGGVLIASGDSTVGGTKATITSEFAQAQTFAVLTPLIYTFFVAILVGLTTLRDEELNVGDLLHATPLRPVEYVLGKFGAGLLAVVIVLALHVLLAAFFNHATVDAESSEIIGPLDWGNYGRAALVFALPVIVLTAGTAFWIGALTRNVIAVFVFPLVGFAACVFFLWEWTPSWLDPRIDRALMWIDPTGFRWLQQTWLSVDRGVEFYNTESVPLHAGFLASRIGHVAIGLLAGLWTARSYRRVTPRKPGRERAAASPASPSTEPVRAPSPAPLATLGMRTVRPSLFLSFTRVLRVELRELRAQPGLYLFVPLILLDTVFSQLLTEGAFQTELNKTPGLLAVDTIPNLTTLVALLLMFYTVESLRRERRLGLAGLLDATPVRSLIVLAGKITANAVIGGIILAAAFLGCWIVLAAGGAHEMDPWPFLLVWGGILVPTYFLWCAFVAFLYSVSRNAYATYALSLAAVVGTGWLLLMGDMNWARNWALWSSTVSWSDFGVFPMDREALVWNRVLVLSAALMFLILSWRFFPRTELDAQRTLHRFLPRALGRSALVLAPLVVPVVGLYFWISHGVAAGWDGDRVEELQKNYWRKNVATWLDAPQPEIVGVDVDLVLTPDERQLSTQGTFALENRTGAPLRAFALTVNRLWDEITWTWDGEPYEPEDREGLHVFRGEEPLAPGEGLTLGFELSGSLHAGWSKNGGSAPEFVLPEGVVLTSFRPTFVPTIGFNPVIGVDEENQAEGKVWPEDHFEGETPSAFGAGQPFPVRLRVTAPERFTINGIGVATSDTVADGLRTVVWETDQPVSFFNVIAGEYAVAEGDGASIYHHPAHTANIEGMLEALSAARHRFSEWFYPYPWQDLKLTEFPALAGYAQGFATNITFAEGMGFFAKVTHEVDAPFTITAHEAAHQWWGNLLVPGEGPGGNVLSEGMAHFSTILLTESERGLSRRIQICRRFEEAYGERRVVDTERPLVLLGPDARSGDQVVLYEKGGWVFWMLYDHLGRDACLEGLQSFIAHYRASRDHPVLQDFTAHMRAYATDLEAYDAFVEQWFHEVVVPRFVQHDVTLVESEGTVEAVTLRLENAGTGTVTVEVAALAGDRFPDESGDEAAVDPVEGAGADEVVAAEDASEAVRGDARTSVTVGPGESVAVRIPVDFRPDRVEIDPDALVLQLDRDLAVHRF